MTIQPMLFVVDMLEKSLFCKKCTPKYLGAIGLQVSNLLSNG